jgi:hypothetical protein
MTSCLNQVQTRLLLQLLLLLLVLAPLLQPLLHCQQLLMCLLSCSQGSQQLQPQQLAEQQQTPPTWLLVPLRCGCYQGAAPTAAAAACDN